VYDKNILYQLYISFAQLDEIMIDSKFISQ